MGSAMSNHNPRRRHQNFEKADPDDDNSSTTGPECLSVKKLRGREKRRYQEQQCKSPAPDQKRITPMVKTLTLREWILSSPGREPECINGGEPIVFSPPFKRMCPPPLEVDGTSISMTASPCKARGGLSLEKPFKISGEDDREEEEQEEGVVSSASLFRTESGRSTKTVRFRSPGEADVIYFHSPQDEY